MKQISRKVIDRVRFLIAERKRLRIFHKFEEFTMIPEKLYSANLELAGRYSSVPGAVVECGTWKGGMIAGIASLLGNNRTYWLFDSFAGLPPAKEIDGEAAHRWQMDKSSPSYYDNCTASEQDAKNAMELAAVPDSRIVKGWFQDTLPKAEFPEGIAILRMDADWYDPTMEILDNLFNFVNKGGAIIIDDYYAWEGSSKAVHDFLSKRQCIERINVYRRVCYIEKR
ncbi:MAG TPA: TylF/MycF/NovP-related O-methyltransferase [Anaerolineales bacterium]|nr:TylF/MycF/NovP-related O-methyltransferase [Anaerolineales bacterium]